MAIIQTKAGESLADQYQVAGSSVEITELRDKEGINLSHDMGAVLLSERMELQNRQISAEAVAQGVNFEETFTAPGLADAPSRLIAIRMIANETARILRATLMLQDPQSGREVPLFAWDSAADAEVVVLWSDNGAARAGDFLLAPVIAVTILPVLLVRMGALHTMPNLILTGRTEAFGAGTVTLRCLMTIAAPIAGPTGATVGLPIPSW